MSVRLDLKVIPGAKKNLIIDLLSTNKNIKFSNLAEDKSRKFNVRKEKVNKEDVNGYKVYLTAPPVDGKANECLIKFLADHFGVSKSKVEIIKGLKSRYKTIIIELPSSQQNSKTLVSVDSASESFRVGEEKLNNAN